MRLLRFYIFAKLLVMPLAVSAETELSFYGGAQEAQSSNVAVRADTVIPDGDFRVNWDGRSFDAPVYYGIRATRWQSATFGFGIDFAHNKIYPETLPTGYDRLEFTDGLNTLTLNAYRRWEDAFGGLTPYIGGGVGVAIPHVEVTQGGSTTRGYQLTGPAATWIAGASFPISDDWSLFGEYKGTFSSNIGDLDTGGTVATDVFTNAVNIGVSFNF